jgi:hypothetical protein
MLFRAPGKTNPYEHSAANFYHELVESSQRSTLSSTSNTVIDQKYQEKITYNNQQPFFNVQVNGALFKKVPMIKVECSNNRPSSSCYKTASNLEYSQAAIATGNEMCTKKW